MKRAAFGLAAAIVLVPLTAAAAPQILALMAAEKALVCEGEVCRAEFSAMCLEERRTVPLVGTAYELLPGSTVTLSARGGDGKVRRIDRAPSFTTLRGQLAIELALPRSVAGEDAGVSVSIPKTAFLLPKPVAGDPDPITLAEVRAVLRQHLAVAPQFETDVAAGLASTRLLSVLITALPRGRLTPAAERRIAESALAPFERSGSGPEARALIDVRGAFENCDIKPMRQVYGGVRNCLQVYHDSQLIGINTAYWSYVRRKGG